MYTKIRSSNNPVKFAPTNLDRVEFFEKELIDMKIRLDVMDMDDESLVNPGSPTKNAEYFVKPETKKHVSVVVKHNKPSRVPNMSFNDSLVHVLGLITKAPMTSRDVEVTFGDRSREHVSRLMKKLFEDGFVDRDISARPYRYSITEKGTERVNSKEGVVYAVPQ